MKAVILCGCGLVILGAGLYFAEGFVQQIPRPIVAQVADGMSAMGLTGPQYGPPPLAMRPAEATLSARAEEPQRGETAERPIGTSGREGAGVERRQAPSAEEVVPAGSPGQHVELRVRADDVNNDAAFIVGTGENRMLVAMNRDTRTSADQQNGVPPRHGIAPVDGGGHVVTIAGTIEKMPRYPEEMASWNLTRSEKLLLAEKGVYVRAERVTPDGYTATAAP